MGIALLSACGVVVIIAGMFGHMGEEDARLTAQSNQVGAVKPFKPRLVVWNGREAMRSATKV